MLVVSIWTSFLLLQFCATDVATETDCSSNPCLNNGTCVPAFFRCECTTGHSGQFCDTKTSTDSHRSLGEFTSGFLSGMAAMLFLFVTVCGSMYFARKYEENKELKRLRKRQEVLQIQGNGNN